MKYIHAFCIDFKLTHLYSTFSLRISLNHLFKQVLLFLIRLVYINGLSKDLIYSANVTDLVSEDLICSASVTDLVRILYSLQV